MADENVVTVAVRAEVGELDPAMQSSASSVNDAYTQMATAFKGMEDAAKQASTSITASFYDVVAASQTVQEASRQTAEEMKKSAEESAESFKKFGETVREVVENPLKALGQAAKMVADSLGPVGVAAAVVGSTFIGLAKEAMDLVLEFGVAAREASNLAARLGLTTEQAEQLTAESKLAGVNINALSSASHRLGQALEEPGTQGKAATEALQKLGIQMYDTEGNARTLGPVLLETLDALSKITNDAERAAIAYTVLGRASKEILPMIKQHQDLKQVVHELGVGLDEEETAALLRADAAASKLSVTLEETKRKLAASLTPLAIPVLLWFQGWVSGEKGKVNSAIAEEAKKALTVDPNIDPDDEKTFKAAVQLFDVATENRIRILDATGKAAAAMFPAAQEAARLTEAFKAQFDASRDGLEKQLKTIQDAREKLAAVINSKAITDPKIVAEKTDEYARLTAEQARIQALLKTGHDYKLQMANAELDAQMAHIKEFFGFQSDNIKQQEALGQITGEERLTRQQALDDREYAQLRSLLEQKLTLAKNLDPNNPMAAQEVQSQLQAIEDAYIRKSQANAAGAAEAKKKLMDEEQKYLAKVMAETDAIREKELEKELKDAQERLAIRSKARDVDIATEVDHQKHLETLAKTQLDFEEKIGQISVKQHAEKLRIIENDSFASAQKQLQYELDTLDKKDKQSVLKEAELNKKLENLRAAHNLEILKLDNELALSQMKIMNTMFDGVSRAFQQSLNGVMQGTQTIQQAFARMGTSILSSWVSDLAQMLIKSKQHAIEEAIMDKLTGAAKIQTAMGVARAQAAVDDLVLLKKMDTMAQVATLGAAARAADGAAQVWSAANIGAANAYAATALIPIVGPELAPAAADLAFADIMAFLPPATAERGALMSSDALTMLHANEMVLPARLSAGVQAMIDSGGTGGGSKTVNVHFSPSIQTLDSRGFQRAVKNNMTEFVAAIRSAHRDGAFA